MSSNSIRISEELFDRARQEGAVMSRSTAQQIEHWARMGSAMEASGVSVGAARELVRHGRASDETRNVDSLWREKRERQAADIDAVRSGRAAAEDMSWFAGGWARGAELPDSPY